MPKQPRAGRRVQYRRLLKNLYSGESNKPRPTVVSSEECSSQVTIVKEPIIEASFDSHHPIKWVLYNAEESRVVYPTGILVQDPRIKRYLEQNIPVNWVLRKISFITSRPAVNIPTCDPRRAAYLRVN